MKKVAIYGKIHSEGINILKKNKYEVIEIYNDKIQKSILKENLKDVEAIAIRTATLDKEILNVLADVSKKRKTEFYQTSPNKIPKG